MKGTSSSMPSIQILFKRITFGGISLANNQLLKINKALEMIKT